MLDVICTDLAKIEGQWRFTRNLKVDIRVLRPQLTYHPVCSCSQFGSQRLDSFSVRVQPDDDQSPTIVPNEQRIWPIQIRDGTRHSRHTTQGTGQEAQCICAFC